MKSIKLYEFQVSTEYNTNPDKRNRFTRFTKRVSFDFINFDKESFAHNIAMWSHTQIKSNRYRRKNEHFKSSCGLVLDFDNKDRHSDSTIEEFISSEFAKQYSYILYTSKSHKPGNDCYHVFIPFDRIVTDVDIFRISRVNCVNQLLSSGISLDIKALGADVRIVASSIPNLVERSDMDQYVPDIIHHVGDFYKPTDAVIDYGDIKTPAVYKPTKYDKPSTDSLKDETVVASDKVDMMANYEYKFDMSSEDNLRYGAAFKSLSYEAKYSIVMQFCRYMNTQNKNSGWTKLTDGKIWRRFAAVFHNLFGYEIGLSLFTTLSVGFVNSSGVRDDMDRIKNSYNLMATYDTHIAGFGTFMNLAGDLGYKLSGVVTKSIEKSCGVDTEYGCSKTFTDILKQMYNAHEVTLIKFDHATSPTIMAEIVMQDGVIETENIRAKRYSEILSKYFNVNSRFFINSYKTLLNATTNVFDTVGYIIKRLKGKVIEYESEYILGTGDIYRAIKETAEEYNLPVRSVPSLDNVVDRLFTSGFISFREHVTKFLRGINRTRRIYFCKNMFNTDVRVNEVLGEFKCANSKEFIKEFDNGDVVGVTSTDVVFTLTSNAGVISRRFKDGSVNVADVLDGCHSDLLDKHKVFHDKRFIEFLEKFNKSRNRMETYTLEFHWDQTNRKFSKNVRKSRSQTNSERYLKYRTRCVW